jgi:hypothetical protein
MTEASVPCILKLQQVYSQWIGVTSVLRKNTEFTRYHSQFSPLPRIYFPVSPILSFIIQSTSILNHSTPHLLPLNLCSQPSPTQLSDFHERLVSRIFLGDTIHVSRAELPAVSQLFFLSFYVTKPQNHTRAELPCLT